MTKSRAETVYETSSVRNPEAFADGEYKIAYDLLLLASRCEQRRKNSKHLTKLSGSPKINIPRRSIHAKPLSREGISDAQQARSYSETSRKPKVTNPFSMSTMIKPTDRDKQNPRETLTNVEIDFANCVNWDSNAVEGKEQRMKTENDDRCMCPRCHDHIPDEFYCLNCGYVPNWRLQQPSEEDKPYGVAA